MPRNSFTESASGMFDGLKSRLGFGRNDEEYDSYEDDGYDDGYDDEDEFDEYDDEETVGGYRPVSTTRSSSGRQSRFGRADSAASNLVSIEDVKAHTPVPDRLQRDPLADTGYSSYSSSRGGYTGHTVIDETAPAPGSPAHNAAIRDGRLRSDGLDSLFEPSSNTQSFDPYEAYSSSMPSAHRPGRSMSVIKPTIYGDVERVAKAVRSGDVVVLVMRNTPDELSKRILDFSFGVASALDANVECPGDKVFAIARGEALTAEEKQRLRNQGAL